MHDVTVLLLLVFLFFYKDRLQLSGTNTRCRDALFCWTVQVVYRNEQLECDGRRAGNNRSPSSSACIPVLLTRIVGIHTLFALVSSSN
jgi:hypothetical protein